MSEEYDWPGAIYASQKVLGMSAAQFMATSPAVIAALFRAAVSAAKGKKVKQVAPDQIPGGW